MSAPTGALLATWEEKGNPFSHVTASFYAPGTGTWSIPELVADGTQARSALSPQGDAIVMWRQAVSGNFQKWRRIYRPGTGWNAAAMQ